MAGCSLQVGGCRSEFQTRSRKNLKWRKKGSHTFLIPDHPQAPQMIEKRRRNRTLKTPTDEVP